MPPKAAGIQPLSFTLFCSSIPSSFFHIHLLVDFYLLLSCLAAHFFQPPPPFLLNVIVCFLFPTFNPISPSSRSTYPSNSAPVKAATAKAKAAAANVKKGVVRAKAKIRTSVHFHRPSTLKAPRAPKYQRRAVPTKDARLDHHSVIK
jgi:hypothetical protein